MSGWSLVDEVWQVVLGPFPDDALFQGHNPSDDRSWPPEGEGPRDGVFFFRCIAARVNARGATVEGAEAERRFLARELQSGRWKAVAVHPDTGREIPIPPTAWQATGDPGRTLWWSGLFIGQGGSEDTYDIYLFAPEAPPSRQKEPAAELGSRERNTVARLVYGLALVGYGDDVDKHGTVAEIARDLEARGLGMSADTVAKWIKAGREEYDSEADTTRKS